MNPVVPKLLNCETFSRELNRSYVTLLSGSLAGDNGISLFISGMVQMQEYFKVVDSGDEDSVDDAVPKAYECVLKFKAPKQSSAPYSVRKHIRTPCVNMQGIEYSTKLLYGLVESMKSMSGIKNAKEMMDTLMKTIKPGGIAPLAKEEEIVTRLEGVVMAVDELGDGAFHMLTNTSNSKTMEEEITTHSICSQTPPTPTKPPPAPFLPTTKIIISMPSRAVSVAKLDKIDIGEGYHDQRNGFR